MTLSYRPEDGKLEWYCDDYGGERISADEALALAATRAAVALDSISYSLRRLATAFIVCSREDALRAHRLQPTPADEERGS